MAPDAHAYEMLGVLTDNINAHFLRKHRSSTAVEMTRREWQRWKISDGDETRLQAAESAPNSVEKCGVRIATRNDRNDNMRRRQ